jgi:hypothetical protein
MSNEHQLEKLVQRQRLIIAFLQAAWTQAQEQNARLRRIIIELQNKLEEHGLSSEVTSAINADQQLSLPLFPHETVQTKIEAS